MMVEQRNSYGATVEKRWCNSERDMEDQWNNDGRTANSDGGTEEKL